MTPMMTRPAPPRTAPGAEAMAALPYKIVDRRIDATGTVTLTMLPRRLGHVLARFLPGQFTMLSVPGVGEIPVSVSGDPDDQHGGRLVQTIRSVGAVSTALCRAATGDVVGVRGPYGHGWNLGEAFGRDVLVVAGGIGLAPLRPLVLAALHRREHFGRITLLVGARTRRDLLFDMQLEAWTRYSDIDVAVTVDVPDAAWRGRVGLVTGPLTDIQVDPLRTNAYVCGPEAMIRVCAGAIAARGVPPERIRVSLERNMKCGVGWCGRCQLGPVMLCRHGPVLGWDAAAELLAVKEL